jgi:Xaa-Pro dipeptidase
MQKQGIDCLYLIAGRNQRYFSGYSAFGAGWPTWLSPYILPLEGEPVRVTTPMFEDIIETATGEILGKKLYLYTDGDVDMAKKQLKQSLVDLKVRNGTIGIEDEMRHTDYELLREMAPDATIKNVSEEVLDPIRMIKDELEIENQRKSAALGDLLLKTATEVIKEGVTYYEMRLALAKCIIEGGADIASLTGGNLSHKIQKGEAFDLEPIVRVGGYAVEVARTFFVGEATRKERVLWQACMDAYDAVESIVRPGVTMHELDLVCREAMREGVKEFLPNYIQGWKVGHGMGLPGGHEPPMVQENNMTKAAPGMVFVIDPGVIITKPITDFSYSGTKTGTGVPLHIISTVLVTEKGCERLDKFTHDLIIL